ncbi:MAG: DM13 domain-containing protein [Gemmatimonadota bacterium]|nr:DM13 domain-containing protein [Gemmatimonadota bacterium]
MSRREWWCMVALTLGCSAVPPTAPDATPDAGQPPLMGQGVPAQFVGAGGHQAAGTVTVRVEGNRARLDFSADFLVDGVPGPYVYLNTTNNPNSGAPLRVAALQRNSGSQTYTFLIPAGVSYTWVLVWCDPFNVGVGEARIP